MATFRVITEESELEAFEPEWRAIYERCGDESPFLSYDWMAAWWHHFGQNRRLAMVAILQDGSPVGIAPLMLSKRAGCTRLEFLGRPLSDYSDFLIAEDHESNFASLTEYIGREMKWDALELRGIREDSPNFSSLRRSITDGPPGAWLTRWRPSNVAPYLSLKSTWQEYSDGLERGLRSDTRRQVRRLEQQGDLSFRECETIEEVGPLLERFSVQKSQRYTSTGAKDILRGGGLIAFFKDVAARLWERGQVHVSSLNLGDRPLAVHFGFLSGDRYFYYMPSFDADFSGYSPGRLLLTHLVERSFSNGHIEFDFMAGADGYKYDWTSKERVLFELTSFRRSPRGLALLGLHETERMARGSSKIRRLTRRARRRNNAPTSSTPGPDQKSRQPAGSRR